MNEVKEQGLFWLPEQPDKELAGELTFDEDSGTCLSLVGTFDAAHDWPDAVDVILGTTAKGDVTLLDAFGGSSWSSHGVASRRYTANKLLIGHQFESTHDVRFTSASARYTRLGEWIGRTGVDHDHQWAEGGGRDTIALKYEPPTAMTAQFAGGSVSVTFAYRRDGDAEQWKLAHYPAIRLQYDCEMGLEKVLQHIHHIQCLLSLCMDIPVATREVQLFHSDLKMQMLNGSFIDHAKPIEYLVQPITSVARAERESPRYDLSLGFETIGGVETLARWIDVAATYRPVINRLAAMRGGMKSYMENRFLSMLAAAEAFDRSKYRDSQLPQAEFDELAGLMLSVVPAQHGEWVSQKLKHMNEPTLRRRLQRLARDTHEATHGLTGRPRDWAEAIKDVRNALTHLDEYKDDMFSGGSLYWLSESVFGVLRVAVLKECISSDDVWSKLAVGESSAIGSRIERALAETREALKRHRSAGNRN